MSEVPVSWFLTLSAILFALGVAGFLFRRNIITVFMSIELMLNAVNLSFVTFSYQLKKVDGHLFTFFVMVVAAAEAAVGLAIILTVFKNRQTLNVDDKSDHYLQVGSIALAHGAKPRTARFQQSLPSATCDRHRKIHAYRSGRNPGSAGKQDNRYTLCATARRSTGPVIYYFNSPESQHG